MMPSISKEQFEKQCEEEFSVEFDENFVEEAFHAVQTNAKKIRFNDPIERIPGHKYHVVIGNIDSGKSQLINFALGTNLQVGIGGFFPQCTQVAVSKSGKVHVFVAPGIQEYFSSFPVLFLRFFQTVDRIFILYSGSLGMSSKIWQNLKRVKSQNIYVVRARYHTRDIMTTTFEEDKHYLYQTWSKIPLLITSAQMPRYYGDNDKFVRLLKGNIMTDKKKRDKNRTNDVKKIQSCYEMMDLFFKEQRSKNKYVNIQPIKEMLLDFQQKEIQSSIKEFIKKQRQEKNQRQFNNWINREAAEKNIPRFEYKNSIQMPNCSSRCFSQLTNCMQSQQRNRF